MTGIRILLADDHPLCRHATGAAILAEWPGATIEEAGCFAEVLALLARGCNRPDLVLLDLAMPDRRGLAGLVSVLDAAKAVPVLVVSGNEAPDLADQIRALGASGFVPKSAPLEQLLAAVESVLAGADWAGPIEPEVDGDFVSPARRLAMLSAAERRVLGEICDGSLNKQVAYRLDLSEITVKQHVKAILRKLGVANRTQAAVSMQFHFQETAQLR